MTKYQSKRKWIHFSYSNQFELRCQNCFINKTFIVSTLQTFTMIIHDEDAD